MKIKILVILLILVVIITGGLFLYYTSNKLTDYIVPNETMVEEDDVPIGKATKIDTTPVLASGKPAPDFILKNLEGEDVSLSHYKGKIVLLNFWGTWCGYCDMEMPDLQKLDKENEDLVVLAVDVQEDRDTVANYIEKGGYDFHVALDSDGKIAQTYLVSGYPTSYFIDAEGILLGSVPGMMTYEQMNEVLNSIR